MYHFVGELQYLILHQHYSEIVLRKEIGRRGVVAD
jgi:hypothetical protein